MNALERHARDVTACRLCPRLTAYREEVARTRRRAFAEEEYWGRPVPGFGDPRARVVLVGLAPAAHGANRTGRMFTGDGSDGMGASDFLTAALHATGFASIPTSLHAGDGLVLTDLWLTAAVRCAPPGNRPAPDEVARCAPWLDREIALLPRARCVVALGALAHRSCLRHLAARGAGLPRPRPRFAHGAVYAPGDGLPVLLSSYHPSRQNTQTRRLTQTMLRAVLRRALEVAAS